jgi:hypothetical protein
MYTDVSEMLLLTPGIGTPLKLIRPAFQDAISLDIAYFGETDRTLLRQGFIVVGDAVIANGSVSSCMRLWTRHPVVPAYRPDQMLVVRDIADGSFVIELTDGNCDVVMTLQTSIVAPTIAFRLAVAESDTDIPVGGSHFGGQPDVPDSFEWMTFQGRPYAFLAQLRCDELRSASAGSFDFDAAEVLIDATRSAWPDHRIFGQPDLRFADENRSFLLKIAADEALGVWARNGWLNVDMPEGVELVAALEDCQVQTVGGHPGV